MPGNEPDPGSARTFRWSEPAAAPQFPGSGGQVLGPPADRPWLATRTGWWEFHPGPAGARFTAVHVADPAAALAVRRVSAATPWALEEQLGFALPHLLRQSLHRLRPPGPPDAAVGTATTGADAREMPDGPAQGGPVHGVRGLGPTWASRLHLPDQPDLTAAGLSYRQASRADPPGLRDWSAGDVRLEVFWSTSTMSAYRLWHRDHIIFAGEDTAVDPLETDDAGTDQDIRRLVDDLTSQDPDTVGMTQRRFIDQHGEDLRRALTPPSAPYPVGTRVTDASLRRGTVRYLIVEEPGGPVSSYGWRPDLADLPGHPWHNLPHAAVISPAAALVPTIEGADVGIEGWTPERPLAYGALVAIPNADDTAAVTATVIRSYQNPGGIVYHVQPHDYSSGRVILPAMALTPIRGTAWPSWDAMIEEREKAGIVQDPDEIIDFAVLSQPGIRAEFHTTPSPAPSVTIVADTVQVRDLDHGLITAPLERFTAALAWDRYHLAELVAPADTPNDLTGGESTTTLAALAARDTDLVLGVPPSAILDDPYPGYHGEPDVGFDLSF